MVSTVSQIYSQSKVGPETSKGTYRTYMSFRIAYRTQTLGVPKSLKGPHITRVLGTPGPHIPSDMGLSRPHITRDMGTGVPILGGPHFTQTPVDDDDDDDEKCQLNAGIALLRSE